MAKIKSIVQRDGRTGQILSSHHLSSPVAGVGDPGPASARPATVGLGDLVETFAKPVAHLIDAATSHLLPPDWQTRLAGCSACARRRNKLNLLCPDIERCPVLEQILGLLTIGVRNKLMLAIQKKK
jgi:hypothetical protein